MEKMLNKEDTKEVLNILNGLYPEAKCELNFSSPFQLLVATILSAQTTDKKVNQVTEKLFEDYPDLDSFLEVSQEELQERIKTIGLYKGKSSNIIKMCKALKENFNGCVPDNYEDLISLAGVGRKTANVVLSNAFNVPAIAVDTHVFRVSNRIGLADSEDVFQTEKDLMSNIDKDMWSKAHHLLIFHGRRICKARKPLCEECPVDKYCHYFKENILPIKEDI